MKEAEFTNQVDQEMFSRALMDLGHDPKEYSGKKISLDDMCRIYEFKKESVVEAIEKRALAAHYDYFEDKIWVDALEAAHFYYCVSTSVDALYRKKVI